MEEELIKRLVGKSNAIFQKRRDFYAVFAFEDIEECFEILHGLSYNNAETSIYYNREVYRPDEFLRIHDMEVKDYEERRNREDEKDAEDGECGCSDGVCTFSHDS